LIIWVQEIKGKCILIDGVFFIRLSQDPALIIGEIIYGFKQSKWTKGIKNQPLF
jgi:hypothetical protein